MGFLMHDSRQILVHVDVQELPTNHITKRLQTYLTSTFYPLAAWTICKTYIYFKNKNWILTNIVFHSPPLGVLYGVAHLDSRWEISWFDWILCKGNLTVPETYSKTQYLNNIFYIYNVLDIFRRSLSHYQQYYLMSLNCNGP